MGITSIYTRDPYIITEGLFLLNGFDVVPRDTRAFHTALSNLQNKQEWENKLENFIFKSVTIFPWSDELQDSIDGLKMSGYIYWKSNDNENYYIDKEKKEEYLRLADYPYYLIDLSKEWILKVFELSEH